MTDVLEQREPATRIALRLLFRAELFNNASDGAGDRAECVAFECREAHGAGLRLAFFARRGLRGCDAWADMSVSEACDGVAVNIMKRRVDVLSSLRYPCG